MEIKKQHRKQRQLFGSTYSKRSAWMSKTFNVSGDCKPDLHYMVNIEERLVKIKEMVDKRDYFTINRARQYGKTTTLRALGQFLESDYVVVSLDFQMLSSADFENENVFVEALAREIVKRIRRKKNVPIEILNKLREFAVGNYKNAKLANLFENFSTWCEQSEKPIILIIDEVDSATNNQAFLDFLAQLRGYYIDRDETPTFWSVILAGVYDVKNLKRKFRLDEAHKTNSPWNIATDFDINMSFSKKGIAGMLGEYEADYHTRMDIDEMSGLLYAYTSGYPFLVSRLCKLMDEKISKLEQFGTKASAWTKEGFLEAERMILSEQNTLFDSLLNKLTDYPELNTMLNSLLFTGKSIVYNLDNTAIDIAAMFGFIKKQNGVVAIANRIFETRLYNLYLSTSEMQGLDIYTASLRDKQR